MSVLAKNQNHRMIEFRKWCLHLKTEWKFHPNLLQLFEKSWIFRQFLIVFITVFSQQSAIKVGRGLVNVIQSAYKSKNGKENFGQNSFQTARFSSSHEHEQRKSRQWFYENFALHSQHYSSVEDKRVKILLITAAAAASCCLFWWVE